MEIILNNDSLFGQFKSDQDFLDSLSKNMIPCLNMAKKRNLSIVILHSVFGNHVCTGTTLSKLTDNHPLADAEIQKFKRLLHQLESDKEYDYSNNLLEYAYDNELSLLSFFPSNGKYESCFFELSGSKRLRNICTRIQLVKHLIDLNVIKYPQSQKYSFVIHKEDNTKHKEPHFHISAGGDESTIRIKDFQSASDNEIKKSLINGVILAKQYQEDLIELWNFINPKLPYIEKE